MINRTEQGPLEEMLGNLTPEQKAVVDKIAEEEGMSLIQALLVKIGREKEENNADKERGHAP